jgi:mRNA interferase RelE/StbE
MYELTLTRKAQRFYEQANLSLVERLNRCFEQLRHNPYAHPSIKPLKGSFSGYFRYRVGD